MSCSSTPLVPYEDFKTLGNPISKNKCTDESNLILILSVKECKRNDCCTCVGFKCSKVSKETE